MADRAAPNIYSKSHGPCCVVRSQAPRHPARFGTGAGAVDAQKTTRWPSSIPAWNAGPKRSPTCRARCRPYGHTHMPFIRLGTGGWSSTPAASGCRTAGRAVPGGCCERASSRFDVPRSTSTPRSSGSWPTPNTPIAKHDPTSTSRPPEATSRPSPPSRRVTVADWRERPRRLKRIAEFLTYRASNEPSHLVRNKKVERPWAVIPTISARGSPWSTSSTGPSPFCFPQGIPVRDGPGNRVNGGGKTAGRGLRAYPVQ